MFRENIIRLRSIHNWSQEMVASKIGISRQAYSKWESGESLPDIKRCADLAALYGVSIDSLIEDDITGLPPAPKGKNIWGSVTLSENGEIKIPKAAGDMLGFTPGMRLVVLSDENGIALVASDVFERGVRKAIELSRIDSLT